MPSILIVDDEFAIADALQELLSWEGYGVVVASNGEQGLTAMAREKPDLVLLDYMMPVMDGLTMLRTMRDEQALKGIPVVLMSAAPLEHAPGAELADVRLRKPLDGMTLLRTIERLLRDGRGGA